MIAAGLVLVGGAAFAYEFGASATFQEFSRDKEGELLNYLQEALTKMENGEGVTDKNFSFVNVRITLRNPRRETWQLSQPVVDLIRKLALGSEDQYSQKFASLWIEANPDYLPGEYVMSSPVLGTVTVRKAFRSFDLDGGPIAITTIDAPLVFGGPNDASSYRPSVLYGLTFEGCKSKTDGGAIVTGKRTVTDPTSWRTRTEFFPNCVRIVNCTFNHCLTSDGNGGAICFYSYPSWQFGADWYCRFDPMYTKTLGESDLTRADAEAVGGSDISHCTFNGCTSEKSHGGAICGVRGDKKNVGTVITDCTFNDCKCPNKKDKTGRGGAIYQARTAYRCTFNQCSAGNYAGGCYGVYYMISCLFRECTSVNATGGVVDRDGGEQIRILNCTFDNCKSQIDKGYAIEGSGGDSQLCACLLHNTTYNDVKDSLLSGISDSMVDQVFLARPGDYHIRPGEYGSVQIAKVPSISEDSDCDFRIDWAVLISASPSTYAAFYDRDGQPLKPNPSDNVQNAGCYRYYNEAQWAAEQERRRPNEWKVMNPLVVTVADDIDENPKDCKISFREACKYLEQHITAPVLVSEDQWPRITFSLPNGGRTVNLLKPVGLPDGNLGANTLLWSVVIDGGMQGVTMRNQGPASRMFDLGVAGVVSNILFRAGTVSVSSNTTPSILPIKRNMNFENCVFEGGTNADCLVKSSVGNVNFTGCSFAVPKGGRSTGAAQLTMTSGLTSRFDCCTFTGFLGINGASCVISAMDNGGELRLSNCTFAGNDGVNADVRIGSKNKVVRFYALNCIFGDGFGKAYSLYPAMDDRTVFCPLWPSPRYDPAKKGELMANIAGARGDLFDSDLVTRVVNGIMQYGFKPKHAATARYGQGAYTFADDTQMAQPTFDIFRLPQTGGYHSMGSFYIDDREAPSIAVSTAEDVTDPYDDVISLREAIAYGGDDDRFASQSAITPTFSSELEESGVVTLAVTGSIRVAANANERSSYRNIALRIAPGGGQRLVVRSATNSYDGVFRQEAGTKLLQFDRVRFDRCGSIRGDGGVLDTEGRYRFDDCAFDGCWSTGIGGLPGSELVETVNRAIQAVHDAGITDDFGLAAVCQITNRMNDVAEKLRQVADIMSQAEPDMARVKALADDVWNELSAAVDSACATLSGILVKLQDAEFDVWGEGGKLDKLREAQNLVTACKGRLQAFLEDGGFGLGGAIRARAGSDGIMFDASASRCYAMSAGGVIASEGRLVGANLTFCRNTAASGAAVHCAGGTNLFASVAFVDNSSATNGALHASGGFCGIVNSLVVANQTASGEVCNITAADGATTNVQYTLCGEDIAKTEVFDNGGEPIIAVPSNKVEQLYYPLDSMGKASGTGAFVFFNAEKAGNDCREAGWLNTVLYSADPSGFNPKPQSLDGSRIGFNTYLMHDLLGNLIESWNKETQCVIPASMGPMPCVAAVTVSNLVTTVKDDAGAAFGVTTLRAAAEYAMSNDVPVAFADGIFSGGKAVFELDRQIDIPQGKALRVFSPAGKTVELRPAEASETNRFFNVFGSLAASGLTFAYGYAKSGHPLVSLSPVNDSDGGAVIGFGPMAFTNCTFTDNRAPGHGGAIYSRGGLTLTDCMFIRNLAGCHGGAVYSDREPLEISGTKLADNASGWSGGAIYVNGSSNDVRISTTDIVGNSAKKSGGGLYLGGDFELEQALVSVVGTDVRLVGNTAGHGQATENVFVEETVKFDSVTFERPPAEYTRIAIVNGVASLVLDEEKARPVLVDFDLAYPNGRLAAVTVGNAVIGLEYGLGRAETPVGPYVVDEWVKATGDGSLVLAAPLSGPAGFYRVMARELGVWR